ncbi:hypothetical protein VP01_760g2 [Puccinia sorghi]|uniref:Uncharacterized protein n=1 Tax=Puccinia sorghi TaxID=27349 RepID=A0A0L6UBU9_9BASI|nr:hypothetical protein VP01_760g2 [Puccinia sorghi]
MTRRKGGVDIEGRFSFGGLSRHRRRIGWTTVVPKGAAGANWAAKEPGCWEVAQRGEVVLRVEISGDLCRKLMGAGAGGVVGGRQSIVSIYLSIYHREKNRRAGFFERIKMQASQITQGRTFTVSFWFSFSAVKPKITRYTMWEDSQLPTELLTGECTKVRRLKIIPQLGKPLAIMILLGGKSEKKNKPWFGLEGQPIILCKPIIYFSSLEDKPLLLPLSPKPVFKSAKTTVSSFCLCVFLNDRGETLLPAAGILSPSRTAHIKPFTKIKKALSYGAIAPSEELSLIISVYDQVKRKHLHVSAMAMETSLVSIPPAKFDQPAPQGSKSKFETLFGDGNLTFTSIFITKQSLGFSNRSSRLRIRPHSIIILTVSYSQMSLLDFLSHFMHSFLLNPISFSLKFCNSPSTATTSIQPLSITHESLNDVFYLAIIINSASLIPLDECRGLLDGIIDRATNNSSRKNWKNRQDQTRKLTRAC